MSLCCVFGWWFGCEPVDRASPGGVRKRTTEESVTNWGRLGFECPDVAICIGVLGSTVSGRSMGRDLPGSGAGHWSTSPRQPPGLWVRALCPPPICHALPTNLSWPHTSLKPKPPKLDSYPAVPGCIGVIRPAAAAGQLVRDAPATNAATM